MFPPALGVGPGIAAMVHCMPSEAREGRAKRKAAPPPSDAAQRLQAKLWQGAGARAAARTLQPCSTHGVLAGWCSSGHH